MDVVIVLQIVIISASLVLINELLLQLVKKRIALLLSVALLFSGGIMLADIFQDSASFNQLFLLRLIEIVFIHVQVALAVLIVSQLLPQDFKKSVVLQKTAFVMAVIAFINVLIALSSNFYFEEVKNTLVYNDYSNIFFGYEALIQIFLLVMAYVIWITYPKNSALFLLILAILFAAGTGFLDSVEETSLFSEKLAQDGLYTAGYTISFVLLLFLISTTDVIVKLSRLAKQKLFPRFLFLLTLIISSVLPLAVFRVQNEVLILLWFVCVNALFMFIRAQLEEYFLDGVFSDNSYTREDIKEVFKEIVGGTTKTNFEINSKMINIETLRSVLTQMKPTHDEHKRTKVNIKYHLLNLLINEGATESRLLWELGFDSYSRAETSDTPLLEIVSNSDYQSQSIASYKRIRKEAIDDFLQHLNTM